jgi:hypothetical protein
MGGRAKIDRGEIYHEDVKWTELAQFWWALFMTIMTSMVP